MGFLDWLRPPAQETLDAALSGPTFMVDEDSIDPAVFGLASYSPAAPTSPAPRIDRRAAMQVPAVKRVRDLIAGSIGQLPVDLIGPDLRHTDHPLFLQPERGVPRTVTFTRLVEDMLFEADAWWHVEAFGWHNYPTSVRRMDPREVTVNDAATCRTVAGCSGAVAWKGKHVHDGEVIRFTSPNDALLIAGARAIRTCLALDSAAYRYADGAPPLDYFTPENGLHIEEPEVVAALDKWADARRSRATGFVPAALKYNIAGWSPEQLQLADARQHAVLEVARLAGVDPEELGVSTTSRTYANQFDRRKTFTDFTLGGYLSTIADRLSMTDVTPRGYQARHNLSTFLRSDDLTRYQTYAAGVAVGAIDGPAEVRALEGKPPLTTAPEGATMPVPAASLAFDATETMDATAPAGTVFAVDVETRTIRGTAVPYGVQGRKSGAVFQFSKGTVHPREGMKVKLWGLHDKTKAVGVVSEWNDTDAGLEVAFKVARGAAGDEALTLAEDGVWDGLSIGPSEGAKYQLKDGVYHAVDIPIHEISLTPAPVFGGARVNSVSFDAEKGTTMPPEATTVVEPAPAVFDATPITEAIAAGFANMHTPQVPARETVDPSAGGFTVNEQLPYRFDGIAGPHSFMQDMKDAYTSNDSDARTRIETFIDEAFAVTTANVAGLNPTQNRPELYVPNLSYSTPLWDLVSTGSIDNKTPFTVPKFSSATGLVGAHTEGVEPTPGAFAATNQTVTPSALSGKVEILREVWDQGGSPATDGIIWGEMLNGWAEAREARIAAILATTATAELNLAGAVNGPLQDAVVNYYAGLQFVRGGNRFTATAADSKLFLALLNAVDTTGRKLFPVLNPANASGQSTGAFDAVQVGSQKVAASWALAATANTRSYNFVPSSVWCWASAPKKFTFEYQVKSIDMAIWGYCATAILRDSDVKPIDYDTADV